MKTYYCVTTTFNDKGTVVAAVTAVKEAAEKPKDTYSCTSRRDIYNDWFDSLEEAEDFVAESLCA